jgi:hypothetical protein
MALSSLVKVEKLTASRTEFYVPLCDVLMDLVEKDIYGPYALKFSKLAHSLAHDFLNIAHLAGKLLWCEGVTPDMNRSPDLIAIGVDAETYLVFLRTAYDTLTGAISYFGIEPRDRGKVPNTSFNSLKEWIEKDNTRIKKFHGAFHFITDHFRSFIEIRDMRDDIVHRAYSLVAFTDRASIRYFFKSSGVNELQWLHGGYKEEDCPDDNPNYPKPLLPLLKQFTISVFRLAEQLSDAIEESQQIKASMTHVLSGVYVPAIHQIVNYQEPIEAHLQDAAEKRRRLIAAWHLVKAGDYLASIERGYPGGFRWRFLMKFSEFFDQPPRYVSSLDFVDCGALIAWKFVFCENDLDFRVVTGQHLLRERMAARS